MNRTKQFEHLKIQLEAIKCATSNFSDHNCIGRGGFGRVYKGSLVHPTGPIVVAVKRLDPAFGQGNPEFWKEIIMLSLYKHENVVTLIGYCDESNEKILVYEFAARRSLDLYLNKDDLTWIRRLKICIGVARGLAYLHNPCGTQQRILHRDIKSSNILVDGDWNAKISDLGLSKFGPANQKYTFCVSNVVGTLGYCDPVYIETGVLTKESDVYSFGVVLFEVLCGRLCINNKNGIHDQSLIGLVRQYYLQNKINEIIYGNIKDGMHPKSLEMFTTIAYRCLKRDLEDRPLMSNVVSVLESALEYQESDPTSQPLVCDRSRERKRGVPWTEDEHRLFLIGLQKVGKGDWRGISRNFVKTRTPTQVAIHAQKYFLRRTNHNRRRRRSSLFDITTDTESDLMTTNITPTSQPLVCITCNSYSGRCWVSFDVMRNKWMSLPEIPTDQDTSNIYAFETRSLAVGSELLVFQTYRVGYQTWKYNLVGQNWIKCDGMYQHRFYFGSATLGSIAIVAGGTDENINSLKSAELYDSSRGSWERLPDMHSSRQLCAGFFMDEKFYVIGGRSNTDWLTCGEEFDLKTKIWRKIEGMYHNVNMTRGQRPLVAVVSNELYAAQYMSTMVIKYNKNNNSWNVLGRLPVPVRADSFQGWGMAFKACGEGLLVVGGQKRPQGEALALYYWSPQSGVKDGVLDWKVIGVKEHAGLMFNVDCAVMGC